MEPSRVLRRFSGCWVKHFPRRFQLQGNVYLIDEAQKKFLGQKLNVMFVQIGEITHPVALDRGGNCVSLRHRRAQKTFSQTIKRMGTVERKRRTMQKTTA